MAQVPGIGATPPAGSPSSPRGTTTLDLSTVAGQVMLGMILASADQTTRGEIERGIGSAERLGAVKVRVPSYETITHDRLSTGLQNAYQRISSTVQRMLDNI